MTDKTLSSYKDPLKHATTSDIIRFLSTNKTEIRDIALSGLDLPSMHDILDLGCGYGFMSGRIASMTAGARILGVDACAENRPAFMNSVKGFDCRPEFENLKIGERLPWKSASFDLVVCTYSLYFFVEVIGEIARILRPDGVFLAITHSEISFRGLYEAIGLKEKDTFLAHLISRFSAENGRETLSPFFREIEKTGYANSLHFEARHIDYLREYIQFKLPLLKPDTDISAGLPEDIERMLKRTLSEKGRIIVDKHDAVFRCRGPVCQ